MEHFMFLWNRSLPGSCGSIRAGSSTRYDVIYLLQLRSYTNIQHPIWLFCIIWCRRGDVFSSYIRMVCSYLRAMICKSSVCPLKTRDNVICKISGVGVTNPMMESSTVLPLHNTAHRAAVQWPAPPRGQCTSVLCCYHRHWYLQIPWSPGACNIIIEQGGNGH